MKHLRYLPIFSRVLFITGAIAGLASAGYPADITYTGGLLNTGTLGEGDTVLISGSAAPDIVLSNGLTLKVSDRVDANGNINLTGKTNVTFEPVSGTNGGKWAVMEYTGATNRSLGFVTGTIPTVESGTQTLNFNNVVFTGGRQTGAIGGGLYFTGNVANELVIGGNIAFISNITGDAIGGAAGIVGSITFTGTTLFSDNRSGWNEAVGAFTYNRNGGALAVTTNATAKQEVTFKDTAMFLSNTTAASGGALSTAGGNASFVFEKEVVFYKNTAGANSSLTAGIYGGAIFIAGNASSAGSLNFKDNVTFEGNKNIASNGYGGALFVQTGGTVFFGGDVIVKDNSTVMDGGGLYANDAPFVIENGGYLFSGNYAGRNGGAIQGGGGATVKGSGTFINNISGINGGAISSSKDVVIGSGAVFENNAAGPTGWGGAIYMAGANTTLTLSAQTDDITFKGNKATATIAPDGDGKMTASDGVSNAIFFASSGTLLFDAAEARTIHVEDSIQKANGASETIVIKRGAGLVEFSNASTKVAGKTTVEEGTFALVNGAIYGLASGTGSFTVKSGATLAGNGMVQSASSAVESSAVLEAREGGQLRLYSTAVYTPGNNLILAGSGTISADNAGTLNAAKIRVGSSIGSAQAQTLTLTNNLTLADGAVLQFDLDAGNASDKLAAANITLTNNAVIDLTWFESGSFNLVTWTGAAGLTGTAGLSLKANGLALTARNNAALGVDITAKTLFLTNEVFSLGLQWTGSDAARIWISSPVANANWSDNAGSGENYFINGDSVTFGLAGQGTVNLVENVIASEMNVTGGDYLFSGTGGITTSGSSVLAASAITVSGTSGKLIKSGDGVLTFSNTGTNIFEEGVEVRGGAVAYQNSAHLVVGTGQRIEFTDSGTLRADAATSTASGTLASNIYIATGKTATFDTQAFDVDYAGAFDSADASSVLAKVGAGTLMLAGDSSAFSGTTRIDTGVLMLASIAKLGGVALVRNGALFGGSGSAAVITTESGATLQAGYPGTADALKVGTLNLAGGSIIKFSLLSGNASDVAFSQNSKLEAGTINLLAGGGDMTAYTINLSSLLPGVYDIGGISTLAGAHVTYGNNLEMSGRQGVLFDTITNPGRLYITVQQSSNDIMLWTGSVGGTWATGENWRNPMNEAISFVDGDAVAFRTDGADPRRREIDVNNNLVASDMRVDDASDYRFHGVGGITTNAYYGSLSGSAGIDGKLKKMGTGAIIFENTGSNVFMGGIDLSGGLVVFNDGRQLVTTGTSGVDAGIAFIDSATLRPSADTTLGSRLNITSGKRAIFDIDNAGRTLVWSGIFDAASSGTLVKTGSGALVFTADNTNHIGSVAVTAGGMFLGGSNARLGGAVAVGANAFFGGSGEVTGAVTVTNGATLQAGLPAGGEPGTLTIASLAMQDGSHLAGTGTLAGTVVIGGAGGGLITADIESGNTLNITAALTGSGTVAKFGDGELVYGSDAALGHAETQINAGVLMLRNVANPNAVSHSFVLNGGWLDLSETDGPVNEWSSGLRLSGETGRVIGKNDQITLGEGTYHFQIGGTTTATQGVYVVIDAGSGTAALTGNNSYAGLTRLKSGVLQVNEDAQLGDTTLHRDVVFEGGSLYITEGLTSQRMLDLVSSGTLEVAAGKTTTWAGTKGAMAFTKTGAGTLVITDTLSNTNGVTVVDGVLRGSAASLSGAITNLSIVDIAQVSGTVSLAGVITGDTGVVNKIGGGTVVIDNGSAITASTLSVKEGGLMLSGTAPLTVKNQFDIVMNASFAASRGASIKTPLFINKGTMLLGKAAGNADYGQVKIDGDYNGYGKIYVNVLANENLIINADQLLITGSATGETKVFLNLTEDNAAGGGVEQKQIIRVEQGVDSDYTFALVNRYTSGAYELALSGDGTLSTSIISPELPAVLGVDIASILIGKASLDSLASRLSSSRANDMPHGYNLWVNGLYRFDQLTSDDYDGSDAATQGVQTGVDKHWARGTWGLTAGLFYDYAKSDMHLPDGKSSTETVANGTGVYLSYERQSLYVDAIFRVSKEDYTITVPGTASFDTDGSSFASSLELGYIIKTMGREEILPYARISYQSHDIDEATDSFGRTYKVDGAESLEGRIGVRMWEQFDWERKVRLVPHFGIAAVHEFKGDTEVTVNTDHEFRDNRIYGAGAVLEGGVTMQLGGHCALNLEGSWYIAKKMENYTINLGFSYLW